MALVRAVLWQHLRQVHPEAPPCPAENPTTLVSTEAFAHALPAQPELQEALGKAYATLWARTFHTLVRQLRGHPEQALQLFVDEVLPYLQGVRVAARLQRSGAGWTLISDSRLPVTYLAGMVMGFAGFSGGRAHVTIRGDTLHIQVHRNARNRVITGVRFVAQLRLPLLVTSVLAASVGMAAGGAAHITPGDVVAVLLGTLAAQSAANATHDLRRRAAPTQLEPPRLGRAWLRFQAWGSYMVAAASLGWLMRSEPGVAVFAAIGLAATIAYDRGRDLGWAPWIAGVTHGPIIVWGAAWAVGGDALFATPAAALAVAIPTGALAAAMLLLDDIADRPLDEAAGRRTLVVRLAPIRTFRLLALLALGGTAITIAWAAFASLWLALAGATSAGLAAWAIAQVRRHSDDPARLADARLAFFTVYAMNAILLTLVYT